MRELRAMQLGVLGAGFHFAIGARESGAEEEADDEKEPSPATFAKQILYFKGENVGVLAQ